MPRTQYLSGTASSKIIVILARRVSAGELPDALELEAATRLSRASRCVFSVKWNLLNLARLVCRRYDSEAPQPASPRSALLFDARGSYPSLHPTLEHQFCDSHADHPTRACCRLEPREVPTARKSVVTRSRAEHCLDTGTPAFSPSRGRQ